MYDEDVTASVALLTSLDEVSTDAICSRWKRKSVMAGGMPRKYQIDNFMDIRLSKWLDFYNACIAECKSWAAIDDSTPKEGSSNKRRCNAGLHGE